MCAWVTVIVFAVWLASLLFCVLQITSSSSSSTTFSSFLSSSSSSSSSSTSSSGLSFAQIAAASRSPPHEEDKPLYASFFTPIDILLHPSEPLNPTITLCQLDFLAYSASPHLAPMFRDLKTKSQCDKVGGNNKMKEVRLEDLKKNPSLQGEGGYYLSRPSGFVFHESRVGSTLVANALGEEYNTLFISSSSTSFSSYSFSFSFFMNSSNLIIIIELTNPIR